MNNSENNNDVPPHQNICIYFYNRIRDILLQVSKINKKYIPPSPFPARLILKKKCSKSKLFKISITVAKTKSNSDNNNIKQKKVVKQISRSLLGFMDELMYVYSFIRINFEKKMYLNPDQLNHRLKCPILLCFLLIYVGCLQNLSKSRLTNVITYILLFLKNAKI